MKASGEGIGAGKRESRGGVDNRERERERQEKCMIRAERERSV